MAAANPIIENDDEFGNGLEMLADEVVEVPEKTDVDNMCAFCGEQPRCRSNCFGICCRKDVKAAGEQAARRGEADKAAFAALRKRGGAEWIELIRTFKAKCSGAGKGWKRAQFDFVAYHMAVQNASRLQRGTKSLWMDELAFIQFECHRIGCSNQVAAQLFHHNDQSFGKGKVQLNGSGKHEMLMPIERFVISMSERAHVEETVYGNHVVAYF